MNSRTVIRELAAAGALIASYPLDLIARQGEPLINSAESEPAILAHGLGGSRSNLLALATYLRMAGFGNIEYFEYPRWQPIVDSAVELGAMVRTVASRHGGVHLVGHSLGGTIARLCAADAPRGTVRSLLTLGSPYSYTQWSPDEIAVFGDEDPIVPPPLEHLTSRTAFGKMVVLRSTGHLALLYHPEVLRIAGAELRARRAQ
jgi:pimeloyl-ACP methyl ester carboxylesterase